MTSRTDYFSWRKEYEKAAKERMKKVKSQIPQWIEFCGKKRRVKIEEHIWLEEVRCRITLGTDPEESEYMDITVNYHKGYFLAITFHQYYRSKKFENAIKGLERKVLKRFKRWGEALNYDVED